MVAVTDRCHACDASLSAGARFCKACGAAVVAGSGACAQCGAQRRVGASFCRACGAPQAGMSPARPQMRSRHPFAPGFLGRTGWVGVAALGTVIAIIGVLAWLLFLRGGEGEQTSVGEKTESRVTVLDEPPEAGPNGFPIRGHVRLDHPSGARAEVPAAEALYGTTVDLRRVPVEPDPAWESNGDGWEFVSYTGVSIQEPTSIELPASTDGAERVIVRTSLGLWVELPSERVTLANGKHGYRVSVARTPAPWTFALAHPKPGAPAPSTEEQEDLRVAQLYWTDRAAWQKETEAWLTDAVSRPVPDSRQVALAALQTTPDQELDRIRGHYRFARRMLGSALAGIPLDAALQAAGAPIGASRVTANAVYATGIRRLVAVRDEWLAFRATDPRLSAGSDGGRTTLDYVDRWIEDGLRDYAPWGVDLAAALVADGTFANLDLRVLVPYGELKWTDVPLKQGQSREADAAVLQETERFSASYPIVATQWPADLSLRLYSTRAIERLAVVDWLKDNVEVVVRWLPVALAWAKIVPGSIGLSIAFSAADQLLNWVQSEYATDPVNPFAFMAFEGGSAGATGGTSFVMDMWEEKVLMAKEGRAMLPAHGLTIAQFAYAVGMFAAVRETDWYVFKSVREVTAGTNGYCPPAGCPLLSNVIPPVMIHGTVHAPLVQATGAYPASVLHQMAWKVEYSGLLDLHRAWQVGETWPQSPLQVLPLTPYAEESWPTVIARTEPDFQAIRIGVPKDVIPADVLAGKTGLADLDPVVELSGPGGQAARITGVRNASPLEDDRDDTLYVAVYVVRKAASEFLESEAVMLPRGFKAGYERPGTMPLLSQQLRGTLKFSDSRVPPLTFDVDFEKLAVYPLANFHVLVSARLRGQYAQATATGSVARKEGRWVLAGTEVVKQPAGNANGATYAVGGGPGELTASCRFAGNNFVRPGSADGSVRWTAIPAQAAEKERITIVMEARGSESGEGPCTDRPSGKAEATYTHPDGRTEIVASTDPPSGPSVDTHARESESEALEFAFPRFEQLMYAVNPSLGLSQVATARAKENPAFVLVVTMNTNFGSAAVRYTFRWTTAP